MEAPLTESSCELLELLNTIPLDVAEDFFTLDDKAGVITPLDHDNLSKKEEVVTPKESIVKSPSLVSEDSEGKDSSCSGSDSNGGYVYSARERKSRAEACRRSRMKRKMERKNLEERNKFLEEEQTYFKSKVASLQNEIQAIKNSRLTGCSFDYKTENMLLRAEVKRHKMFINHINSMMSSIPKFSAEEKLRVTSSAVDSGIGQVLGLCYTSIMDRSWKSVQYTCKGDFLGGRKLVVRYQYLPFGSTAKTATRLNIRQDNYNLPVTCEKLQSIILGQNKELEKEMMSLHMDTIEADQNKRVLPTMEELDSEFSKLLLNNKETEPQPEVDKFGGIDKPSANLTEEERTLLKPIRIFRYQEKKEDDSVTPKEALVLRAFETKTVNGLGFPPEDDPMNHVTQEDIENADEDGFVKVTPKYDFSRPRTDFEAVVAVHTKASSKVTSVLTPEGTTPGTHEVSDMRFDGFVLRPGKEEGTCTLTGVCSIPLSDDGFREQSREVVIGSGDSELPRIIKTDAELIETCMQKLVNAEWT
mmetsp:Transcript_5834/g.6720  ORF Transcript_5834/g.6720 Transcript_5834/m.6720 type:complete len:530 (+) Transcript_5834:127-1716(+)